jgi:hypothetical protein
MKLTEQDKTRIQSGLAIASFSVGVVIACVCLFVIPPLGEITNSAISITSEFLILCGALLGAKVAFDVKMQRWEGDMAKHIDEKIQDAINQESQS